jgi:hypothetical protein
MRWPAIFLVPVAPFQGQIRKTGYARIAQPWIYIRDHGTFPLVTMQRADGMTLNGGSHRMAAFVIFRALSDADLAKINVSRPSINQCIWRGEHSNGELPDY